MNTTTKQTQEFVSASFPLDSSAASQFIEPSLANAPAIRPEMREMRVGGRRLMFVVYGIAAVDSLELARQLVTDIETEIHCNNRSNS